MDNLLAAIAILIQTQQGLTNALNIGGNANTNANVAQLVFNNNNNMPKIRRPSTTTPNKPQRYTNKLEKENSGPVPMELDYARSSS
ncbi:17182_t:CDS:2, partial [Racocetra fulgida]